ncbi:MULTISPECIES: carbapenem-hydrolyzing class A beta-lactamase CRH-1 [Chromobacterium]|uniref:beta-lactamase n=2 Tax=Chromobacterium TaxID=535 RepID=A0ABS3GH82_9NEIS|nr:MULTISPECIES: carbapenem-hydrolyzing class A beta-lactamase CRH-1 [Chromobacterium]AXT46233.1 carbapenem-hydrolyzing class A beta-lactamase CRH-1 [Chromobacterium rhizoryzae]MBK0413305.1 carbapenem-hydrolyzing class A beta-lactamase CRH-1 [Chromobacterium haemolyticum]MBO0414407.1 carbapenem-hydrolyzing class A beta-lactamase CRH-1 [Chromobacterium haemolyticum]MBO0497734.1 carbapenem-hydrolyzing class A beta-lactamase CRH-1 [Chromobacterium haemolyticum]QOD84562.1 carbapenem-hydrolyzing cl
MFKHLILFASLAAPLTQAVAADPLAVAADKLAKLERDFGGSIGVYAIDTGSGATVANRPNERFPMCSSFKGFLAAGVLAQSQDKPGLLDKRIRYSKAALPNWSPITTKHQASGMTVAELNAASVQYSDNGAANLLLKEINGPAALTAFMRSIGDASFRLDRREPELNSAIPGDPRDTSTPKAVAESAQKLALGKALPEPQRQQLADWLKGNTTGNARIRAAVPAGWEVGDKTGTCGVYGTANDFAVIWPPKRAPIVLAVYTKHAKKEAKHSDEVIAAAARAALEAFNVKK